jgi:hypothetical protein
MIFQWRFSLSAKESVSNVAKDRLCLFQEDKGKRRSEADND